MSYLGDKEADPESGLAQRESGLSSEKNLHQPVALCEASHHPLNLLAMQGFAVARLRRVPDRHKAAKAPLSIRDMWAVASSPAS